MDSAQLERNRQSRSFQRLLSPRDDATQDSPPQSESLDDFIKDPYVLEFLQLQESGTIKEIMLEQAIVDELQKFLLELDKGFSFALSRCASAPKQVIFY
jgi:predicted nuclease of restriction endonuclease-like (RecB) superfamily